MLTTYSNVISTCPLLFVENVKKIKDKIICRDQEVDLVVGLLGQTPYDEPPNALFIHGDTGTGKSTVLSSVLTDGKFRYAVVNCYEGYSMKIVYESILNQLAQFEVSSKNNYQPYAKCTYFSDFVENLQKISRDLDIGKNQDDSLSLIIVFDKSEKLRRFDKNILPSLVKLREISGLKLCVVFISTLPWIRFYIEDNATEPITLLFEQYNKKQVLQILMLDKPKEYSPKFYENFVNLFLSVFYQTCKDIRELKYQAQVVFEYYSKPIKSKELTESDMNALWKRSQPFFKKSLRSLYLKMDSEMENTDTVTSVAAQALNMELPFYSKYLLIGAYIASFNPASEDKRLFVKNHGKIRKSKKIKKEKIKLHLVGPRAFGLQRLFAIVAAILVDDKFNLNSDLFMEVATLVRMNLLTQVSEDMLDGPSYKCNVGFQFIDVISKNVQFPIRNYLIDFMDN